MHLAPGTHLSTPRLGFRHHGLYAGHGRVLHYGSLHRGWRRGPVEEVSLADFARGHGVQVVAGAGLAFAGEQAVVRARSRLGEDRYHLWSNNCEHFVTWCLSGTAASPQVEAWRGRLEAVRQVLAWPLRAFQWQPTRTTTQRG